MMSSALTAKLGSVEILKLLTRCGLSCTLVWLTPIFLAMVRTLQYVALTGCSFTVFSTTLSLVAALVGFHGATFHEAFDTGFGKILLPAPNRGLGDADLMHDRHDA